MKHAQRTSKIAQPTTFRLNPVAAAVALALTTQFAVNVAQAGSGFGSGVDVTNAPTAPATYYANSPAGPVPILVNGAPTIRTDGSGLPSAGTTGVPLRKFVDTLPGFGAAAANDLGQYIPIAVPSKWVDGNGVTTGDDYYEIAAVEYTEKLHADLPKATHLRGYVQLMKPGQATTLAAAQAISPTAVQVTYADGVTPVKQVLYYPAATIDGTLGTTVVVPSAAGLVVGATVTGGGFPAGTTILTVTPAVAATATTAAIPASFTTSAAAVAVAGAAAGTTGLGALQAALTITGGPVFAYDKPHHLGPVINAAMGTAVRVKFVNYLPIYQGTVAGTAGSGFFLPVDNTLPGNLFVSAAGAAPIPYPQNRAGMHLFGAQAPWVSSGTPHQWVAPAGETAAYAAGIGKGASTQNAPDMADPGPGATNYYFPNAESARLTFFRDETSGIARLNTYSGLAGVYKITDAVEQAMITGGTIPAGTGALTAPVTFAAGTLPAAELPLIFEDKTFVPGNIAQQDALWNNANWGVTGDLWFPHVYEANQDPAQLNGTNPVGRWDYGPLFWPIFQVSPDKATLPHLLATPQPSFVPEAYMDTVLVNGTVYPSVTVEPKAYRVRLANASNDRYLNLGFYIADAAVAAPILDANGNPTVNAAGVLQTRANTEVKMVPAAAIDAAGSPPGWDVSTGKQLPLPQFLDATGTPYFPWHINAEPSGPTRAWPIDARIGGAPDPTTSGPDFIQIGTDGGFLPGGVDIPSQPVTFESNRRSITVSNIYGYGMLLGPGERADTVVDFSSYAGKTLILFNDGPAPVPFIDARDDYFTGDPDQTGQGGWYSTLPGYGPNTRTVLQVVVGSAVTSGGPLNAAALKAALPQAYAATQPVPLVTQSFYNTAFGTTNPDTFGLVATGSAAQPNLTFSTTGALQILSYQLVTSGGVGTGSGTGYTTAPAVVISGGGGTGATATATVNSLGQVASVVAGSPGTGYTSAPLVTFISDASVASVSVVNGGSGYSATDTVSFIGAGGITATGTLTVSSSSSVSPTLVSLTNGSGYTVPPQVSFTGGTPTTAAVASATLATSTLISTQNTTLGSTSVTVSNNGAGFRAPTAVVSAPQVAGTTATATPIVGFATAAGTPTVAAPVTIALATPAAPALTNGLAPANATWDIQTAQGGTGNATSSAVINFPSPQFGTNGATGTVTVDTTSAPGTGSTYGLITAINITNAGAGYLTAPVATITDAVGNSATVTVPLAAATGMIFGANITNPGSGYTAPATITFPDPTGAGATNAASATAAVSALANVNGVWLPNGAASTTPVGVVTGLVFSNAGQGYSAAPGVGFTPVAFGGVTTGSGAAATVSLSTAVGAITGVTLINHGSGYNSPPTAQISTAAGVVGGTGTGATLVPIIANTGTGAQAIAVTSSSFSYPTLTKAEQELFDDYGRYNSTGGVELPFTTATIQTTIPLNYMDAATEVIGDGEVQIWKLVDNGLWTNSMHFNMANVQLINRVGWDGTIKPPATNEVGWKDTLRLNPLEDVIVAVQGKRSQAGFGQPRSTRLQDPSTPAGTVSHPAAPAPGVAGTSYIPGLGISPADPNVVQQAGLFATGSGPNGTPVIHLPGNSHLVPAASPPGVLPAVAATQLLTATANTNVLPASPTGNYDNEFTWGSAILGHGTNDLQRPVVFNPSVDVPNSPANLADPLGTGTLTWTDPTPNNVVLTGASIVNAAATAASPLGTATVTVASAAALAAGANVIGGGFPAGTSITGITQAVAATAATPAVPASFTTSAASTAAVLTGVTLNIATPGNPQNEVGFTVLQAPVTNLATSALGAFAPFANVAANTANYSEPSLLVSTTPPGGKFYAYEVVAYNAAGVSGVSNVVIEAPPAAPTGLVLTPGYIATGAVSPNDINMAMQWTDNSTNETSFSIQRKGPVATQGALTTAAVAATLAAPANPGTGVDTFTDVGPLQEGQWYEYDLVAHNSFGDSAPVLTGQVLTPAPLVGPTVTSSFNLTVCPTNPLVPVRCAPDDVVLSWTDPSLGITSYTIDRTGGPAGTTFAQQTILVGANQVYPMTFTDKLAQEGYTYTYTVTAVKALAGGAQQTAATATQVVDVITSPTQATNVVITPSTALDAKSMYVDQATITWNDNAYTDTGYQVWRQLGSGATVSPTKVLVGTVAAGPANNPWGTKTTGWSASPTLSFVDGLDPLNPLIDGQAYTWTVTALNNATPNAAALPIAITNTFDSLPVVATMPGILIKPPINLTATPNRAGSSINLCWTDNSNNETDFLVEESLSTTGGTNGTFGAWATPAGSPVTRTAAQTTGSGLPAVCFGRANVPTTAGYVYQFRISARNLANHSDSHPYATISANLNAPAAPVAVTIAAPAVAATATGGQRVTLTWNKLAPAAGTSLTYQVFANGVLVATVGQPALATATTVTYRYNVPLAVTAQSISYTVKAVATALRAVPPAVQTVFGSTTGPLSNAVTATIAAAPANALPPPGGITPTVNATTGAVSLAWTAVTGAPTGSVVSYRVSVNGAAGVTVASGGAITVPRGSIAQVQVATAFRTAAGVTTIGAYSAPVAVNTLPAQSTGLSALALSTTATGATIAVNWANTSSNITGWTIQRGVTGAAGVVTWTTFTPTLSVSGTTYGFTDTVVGLGTYSYRVLATSAIGSTAYVTSGAVTTPLPAPTGITPTVNAATGAVTLAWAAVTPPAGGTVSYRVSVNGGAAVTMASGGALAVARGATYQVAVATAVTVGAVTTVGAYSTPITVNTLPAQSTALTNALAATPARTFNVGFTNTSTNITGWIIQRGVSATAAGAVTWTTFAVTPTAGAAGAYTFSNTVTAAGFYRYRVQATSAVGSTAVVTTPTVQTP